MKIQKRWMSVFLLLIGTGLLSNGCALFLVGAGVAAGAGTVAYVDGELKTSDEVAIDRA